MKTKPTGGRRHPQLVSGLALFCLFLLTSLWPPAARAQFTFTTNNGSITITGYQGPTGPVIIPSVTNHHPVTIIADNAFDAFLGNGNPTSVVIPDSVTTMGSGVFNECLDLTNVAIGDGVTSIGTGDFVYCLNLTAINVNVTNAAYCSAGGILYDKGTNTLVQFPPGLGASSYVIPNTVASISSWAMYQCNVASVSFPTNLVLIGADAFGYCGLTSALLPNGVTTIGLQAFYGCRNLGTVAIPNSVTNIASGAFESSGVNTFTLGTGLTGIPEAMFDSCESLTSVVLSNNITSIADYAFNYCNNLTHITIPDSVTSIGPNAFDYCNSLSNIVIGAGVTNIGADAFALCLDLTAVYYKGNFPSADASLYYNDSGLVSYYLPGAANWPAALGNFPAELWNPLPQTSGASFGVRANQFGFDINGPAGLAIVIEACTNLVNPRWFPVSTNQLATGSAYFSDSQWTNSPARYYRLRSP